MKFFALLSFFILAAGASMAQSKSDTLTNEKIVKLSKLGMQPSVIINKIKNSVNVFDVSTDALIALSDSGVASEVINAMMDANASAEAEAANEKDMNDPMTKRPTGIYYYNAANAKPFRRVDPTVISSTGSGGFGMALKQRYTGGLAKDKLEASIAGADSRLQIGESQPVFYFYFDNNSSTLGDGWFFATATSPNEFALVKLNEKKDSREMVVGTSNAYGSDFGISSKDKVPFDYEEIADKIYKVTFSEFLPSGEYCFVYASSTPTHANNNKVFDFGIVGAK